ncbi:hypothetical protein ZWY2020_023795 [Hordeum vulgare]|nr:hypothetical protein ZWY2020_023795 [Hordeum vulgare]
MNADVENQEVMADGDPEAEERKRKARMLCLSVLLTAPVAIFFITMFVLGSPQPRYYITIGSASGLDVPAAAALNPTFNLTLRVATNSYADSTCVDQDTFVEVAYRRVRLAGATVGRLCAGPRMATERPVVARGEAVRVPGNVMDALLEEMRQGVAMFDVALKLPGVYDGRRLGRICRVQAAATAATMCTSDLYWLNL